MPRGSHYEDFVVKTFSPKPTDIQRAWFVIDAQGASLGRLSTEVARLLRGKHKPIYAPHADTGDHVIVINAGQIQASPKALEDKVYHRHSGYPGGLRTETLGEALQKHPERVIERAVRGMLPKNRLGRQMIGKLRVYGGPAHPHAGQQPQPYELASKR